WWSWPTSTHPGIMCPTSRSPHPLPLATSRRSQVYVGCVNLPALLAGEGKRRDRAQTHVTRKSTLCGDRDDVAGAEAHRAVGGHQEMLADLDLAVACADIGELAALEAERRLVVEGHAGREHDLELFRGRARADARARQIADPARMKHPARCIVGAELVEPGDVALDELADRGLAGHDRGGRFLDQCRRDLEARAIIFVARRRRTADEHRVVHLRPIALHGRVE